MMKRIVSLCFIVCVVAGEAAFGQADANKVCPFSIIGTWESAGLAESDPVVLSFSPEGWVTLLGPLADALPQDFEMIAQVQYKLDKPTAPMRIEFTAGHKNDLFPRGTTSMQIPLYTEDSFVTINPESGRRTEWFRVKTHRYFLTFAARGGPTKEGGSVFALLTTLDGRKTKIEAIGVQLAKNDAGKTLPVFGPIPAEIYEQVTDESDEDKKDDKDKKTNKDETVRMRLELTAAEFEKTHDVFQIWDNYAKTGKLPHSDPYLNGMEFLSRAAEGLTQCGAKADLRRPSRSEREEMISKFRLPQALLEYLRTIRKNNDELHVTDGAFPWGWRPMLQLART